MVVSRRERRSREELAAFEAFVARVEPPLHRALVATYGLVDGREATVDALSWAWEHWEQASRIERPIGYLYRVGQSATRRFTGRALPLGPRHDDTAHLPEIHPDLLPALARLPEQQRTVVVLVHGYGWPQVEVADLLGVRASTVAEHLRRATERLRAELEVNDVH